MTEPGREVVEVVVVAGVPVICIRGDAGDRVKSIHQFFCLFEMRFPVFRGCRIRLFDVVEERLSARTRILRL